MIFVTTFTKEIYNICGKQLLQSFIDTGNSIEHTMYVFFENESDLYTDYYPEWLEEWANNNSFVFINLMNYDVDGKRIIDYVDLNLKNKISFTHEYSSQRSIKWFRPVAAIHYAYELLGNQSFCSIDADCLFVDKVEENFFDELFANHNVTFLGREGFKVMRHGGYDQNGNYVHTRTVDATSADTHTETGFIGFNMKVDGTDLFIKRNFDYWISGDVLQLEYKTDCHTFDATRKELNLSYNNLCEEMGDTSPIGSRVIEASKLNTFLTHNKGTIGPILYNKGLLK
jgi:hypothetical protein